jgi:hypothetical protein
MSEENAQSRCGYAPLLYNITRLYPGKHIVFSEDEQRVIGVGETVEEATIQAQASGVGGLWHYGYGEVPGVWKV